MASALFAALAVAPSTARTQDSDAATGKWRDASVAEYRKHLEDFWILWWPPRQKLAHR